MGLPTIYFYPDSSGTLETITFEENLSDLQVEPIREVSDAVTLSGAMFRRHYASRLAVRIVLENYTSKSFWYKMESLSAHLERGAPIGFSLDHAKTWAGFLHSGGSAARGDAGPFLLPGASGASNGNSFYAWNNSGTLVEDDMVCISNGNPEGFREYVDLDSLGTSTATLKRGLLYSYASRPILFRWRDFFPALKLPQNQMGSPIVTSNHRIGYTLDLRLGEDWSGLEGVDYYRNLTGTTDSDTGQSLQQAAETSDSDRAEQHMGAWRSDSWSKYP